MGKRVSSSGAQNPLEILAIKPWGKLAHVQSLYGTAQINDELKFTKVQISFHEQDVLQIWESFLAVAVTLHLLLY